MAHFLFPDFLNDPQQYQEVEEFWLKNWEELVRNVGQADRWRTAHYTTTFVDGTPCRDANPIFSAADFARRLGVRIIQFESTGDSGELIYWHDTFAEGEPEEIRDLVISCSLTDETLAKARDLIRQWITESPAGTNGDPAANPTTLPDYVSADRPA